MDSSTQKRGEDGWFLDWLRVIMVKLMIMMLKKRRRGEGDCEEKKRRDGMRTMMVPCETQRNEEEGQGLEKKNKVTEKERGR